MIFADAVFQVDQFLQYGSFGVIVLLIIWFIWKGWPMLIDKFETVMNKQAASNTAAITYIIDAFKQESAECREERMDIARSAADEREKDRNSRHELANKFQVMLDHLEEASKK